MKAASPDGAPRARPRLWRLALVVLASAAGICACRPSGEHVSRERSSPLASRAEVERGRYLALAGDCVACHTRPGGAPLAGGRPLQTPFGVVYSTNLTPGPGGLGGWTSAQFHRALTKGVAPGGRWLYPAFPYLYYARVTRGDSDALYAYLRSVPAVAAAPPHNQLAFPFNMRPLLIGWQALFLRERPFRPDPTRSPQWSRGAYLVEGLGHCGACHTALNAFGAPKRAENLQGGDTGLWSAPDLTPNPRTGLGRWRRADLIAFLRTGHSPRAVASAEMAEVVSSSTSHLAEADLEAIATYVEALPPSRIAIAKPDEGLAREGERVWFGRCSACHGAQGEGARGFAPALRGASDVQQRKPATLLHVILSGIPGPGARLPMPAFGERLSDREVAAVATYVRSSWGNRAPAVSVHDVAALRRRLQPLRAQETADARDVGSEADLRLGQQYYRLFNCGGCHGARGGGGVGPPLVDGRWRYGGELGQIHASIASGRPNGMPAFREIIPDRQVWQIAAFVRSLPSSPTNTPPRP